MIFLPKMWNSILVWLEIGDQFWIIIDTELFIIGNSCLAVMWCPQEPKFYCCLVAISCNLLLRSHQVSSVHRISLGEYSSGLHASCFGDLPSLRDQPGLLHWQVDSLSLSPTRKSKVKIHFGRSLFGPEIYDSIHVIAHEKTPRSYLLTAKQIPPSQIFGSHYFSKISVYSHIKIF